MDKVFIRGLVTRVTVGIFDWERRIKQKIVFDIEMATDNKRAAETDSINDTLDYKKISKAVVQFAENSDFQLVETLAEAVAEMVIRDFSVSALKLTLNKAGAVSQARDVGVEIERQRGDFGA